MAEADPQPSDVSRVADFIDASSDRRVGAGVLAETSDESHAQQLPGVESDYAATAAETMGLSYDRVEPLPDSPPPTSRKRFAETKCGSSSSLRVASSSWPDDGRAFSRHRATNRSRPSPTLTIHTVGESGTVDSNCPFGQYCTFALLSEGSGDAPKWCARDLLVVAVVLAGGCRNDDNAAPAPTTITNAPNPAVVQAYADAAAIQQLADYLNHAYAASAADGLAAVAASTYLVWNGAYTADQCISYLRSQLGYYAGASLSETFKFDTLTGDAQPCDRRSRGSPRRPILYTIAVDIQLTRDAATGISPLAQQPSM